MKIKRRKKGKVEVSTVVKGSEVLFEAGIGAERNEMMASSSSVSIFRMTFAAKLCKVEYPRVK